jgi:signal transduction histidine kinase/phage shock protein PspC (stress-responsive transcriptional regulator)
MVAGVCSGLAASMGVEVGVIRLAFVVLSLCGGVGLIAYGVLWLSGQETDEPAPPPRRGAAIDSAALIATVAGIALLCRSIGYWAGDQIALPALVVAAGAALVGSRDEVGRGLRSRGWPARMALGVSLIVVGGAVSAAVAGGWRHVGQSAIGASVLVVGIAFLVWPWLGRLTSDLSFERAERIRSQERADVAAHLHDGVLQTLALIQRRAGDPREVRSMARRQERELRAWLFADQTAANPSVSVAALLKTELAAVEDDHRVRVEVVAVGDAPIDDAARALVAAGREAVVNAARHAHVDTIDVFLEATPDSPSIELFVRDRGVGFNPAKVGKDRHGVAESIRGRVERAGGTAEVRSTPGEGTEVELRVPRPSTNGART